MENSERPIKESARANWANTVPGPGGLDVAEYATPDRSRIDSGFYVGSRGLPWHVALSKRLDQVPLMAEQEGLLTNAVALREAGADFLVEKIPVSIPVGVNKSRHKIYREVPDWYATVRTDTMETLGIVKAGYKVFQQEDLVQLASDVVDASGGLWETGGVMYGGRWVFFSMELPNGIEVKGDPSEHRLFLLLSNGHDGRHPCSLSIVEERAVCRNTVKIGEAEAITRYVARHTSGLEGRIQAIREGLKISFAKIERWEKTSNLLVEKTLVDRQVEKILEDLFPIPERDQDRPERLPETTFGKVMDLYQTSPSIEPIRGTAYGVLNAVTEYLDHFQVYRGRVADPSDVKADSLVFGGPSEAKKDRVLKVLVGIAGE